LLRLRFLLFLASAAGTQSLRAKILPNYCPTQADSVFQPYTDHWLTIFGPIPTGDWSHKQSAWDKPGLQAARDSVERSKSDPWQKQLFTSRSRQK